MPLSSRQSADKRARRTRTRLKALSNGRPRLSVFRSSKNIYAQVIDDAQGVTLAAASSLEGEGKAKGADKDAAARVGKLVAERGRSKVTTPASKMRARLLDVLADEGYIRGYHLVEKPGAFPEFEIELKYFDNEPVIAEIARVSKPGRRVYSSIKDLKPIKNGLGISILSTPKGVMSDNAARDANVGGEVLCRVY